jgi:hypothetical protein
MSKYTVSWLVCFLIKNQMTKKLAKNKFKNKCNMLITDATETFYSRKNEKSDTAIILSFCQCICMCFLFFSPIDGPYLFRNSYTVSIDIHTVYDEPIDFNVGIQLFNCKRRITMQVQPFSLKV